MPAPPESPAQAWQPPATTVDIPEPQSPPAELPVIPAEAQALTLDQVLDVALRNNPRTRVAWASARAAWAELGIMKSAYYPALDLSGNLARTKQTVGGQLSFLQTTYGPAVALTGLLYDFGRREAEVGAARAAFMASGFTLNAVLAGTVLEVEEAYYGYLNASALLAAARSGLADAEESLKAAEDRRGAGVATIAEVLQARTERSRALLAVQETDGQVQALKGALATVMGLPATTPFDAEPLPEILAPPDALDEAIEALVEAALTGRPDLEAARARALEASLEAKKIRAEAWPSLTAGATFGRNYYFHSDRVTNDYYSGTIGLKVPLFTGFEHSYDLRKAEAEAEAAQAESRDLANQVVLQVWNSYYAVRTALKRLATSADLLASADESAAVALERYKSGVGTILDLLSAQSSLMDARAQSVLARSDWLVSVARLAHDTGRLRIPENDPKEK
jgi:TolC family type I secretion outer membrane protein